MEKDRKISRDSLRSPSLDNLKNAIKDSGLANIDPSNLEMEAYKRTTSKTDYTKLMDVLIHNIQTRKRKIGKPDKALLESTSKRLKEDPETGSVQEKNILLQSVFLHACKENNLKDVHHCLSVKDLDINCDSALWTPLMFACIGGHEAVVRELCQHDKIRINQKDGAGLTALHHATKNHSPIVKILASSDDIELNAKDNDGLTAVHHAIVNQSLESIKVLRQFPGVDWNISSRVGTPLVMALTMGRAEILGVLVTLPDINLSPIPVSRQSIGTKAREEMTTPENQKTDIAVKIRTVLEASGLSKNITLEDLLAMKRLSEIAKSTGQSQEAKSMEANQILKNNPNVSQLLHKLKTGKNCLRKPGEGGEAGGACGGAGLGPSACQSSFSPATHKTIGQVAVESLASNAAQCVEILVKHTRIDWNVRNHLGDTPIMYAFKQQKMEIVKVLMRTPGVDLSEIRRQDFTMFQSLLFDAIQEYSNKLSDLRRKVPECPVCYDQFQPGRAVYQCESGHLVCHLCWPQLRLDDCPVCRGDMVGRANTMEQFLVDLDL